MTPNLPLPAPFLAPPRECSLMPFWFWNDQLEESEILPQMDAFERNGIFGFVLHPRVGLPRTCGWMSEELLRFMRFAIEEAARRDMTVILYDDGMYPSGSASGQVVAANPAFACRGLVQLPGDLHELPAGHNRIACVSRANGEILTIIDRPIDAHIRGLHYLDFNAPRSPNDWSKRDTPEDHPPAADLLNPDAAACFIQLVYQRYFDAFSPYFGKTIPAIFTDEPMVLGRGNKLDARPGTTGILKFVNDFVGYDFTPHLPALWYDDEPETLLHRANYRRAINHRLEQTYYRPLHDWCESHRVALTGHPEAPDDIGHLRHFHWPGQDIVWNYIMPGESAISGPQSTQAKCAASAAIHLGRRRNINEFMGAYGHDVSLSLYRFVANWLLVRGTNFLMPHGYFYSVRGPRIDESPPQLGPHSKWWNTPDLRQFHDACARLCWLNLDSTPVVSVAILGQNDHLSDDSARVIFENQIDFHYLEDRHLWEDAAVDASGIHLAGMHYTALIANPKDLSPKAAAALAPLRSANRLILFDRNPATLLSRLTRLTAPVVRVTPPQPKLRARHVIKAGRHWYMLFNEGNTPIRARFDFMVPTSMLAVDLATGELSPRTSQLEIAPGELRLLVAAV